MNQKIEHLANEIIAYLKKHELQENVYMMYNNKRVCIETGEITENQKASDWVEYANNETITITFEGAFYHVLNDAWQNKGYEELEQDFSKLVQKHGYYYELGFAWSLALYEV